MHEFNQSLKYDKRMYAADVKGSIAFSKALLKAGILDEREQKEIERGLGEVKGEWEAGKVRGGVRAWARTRGNVRGGRVGSNTRLCACVRLRMWGSASRRVIRWSWRSGLLIYLTTRCPFPEPSR
jgi:hypothetical protein